MIKRQLALVKVFKKHLREYASKVLLGNLPGTKAPSSSSSSQSLTLSSSMTNFTKELRDFNTSGLIQNFQSLLKEGDLTSSSSDVVVKLNDDEKVLICTFLVTSEYCLETMQQLEGKLKEKVKDAEQINFSSEQDVYHNVTNSCLQLLVRELAVNCEPALTAMAKMSWSTVETVGDQSAYVTALANHVKQAIPLIRDNLVNSRKYFTQFCVKFVSSFIPRFVQNLHRCKPVSTVGAEQLLLDTHSIKTLLLDLPTVKTISAAAVTSTAASAKKAPVSYTKIVVKGMTRAEMTLKVVMSSAEPTDQFVEQCIKLVPDMDVGEFQKVLDMKAIRKVDQAAFIESFRASAPQNATTISETTPKTSIDGSTSAVEESRIKKLENLIKKRL